MKDTENIVDIFATAEERYAQYKKERENYLKGDAHQIQKAKQMAEKLNITIFKEEEKFYIPFEDEYKKLSNSIIKAQIDGWWHYARETKLRAV